LFLEPLQTYSWFGWPSPSSFELLLLAACSAEPRHSGASCAWTHRRQMGSGPSKFSVPKLCNTFQKDGQQVTRFAVL
jgi:hypothetical protein